MSLLGDIEGAAVPGVGAARAVLLALKAAAVAVPLIGWAITAHSLGGVRAWQAEVISATSTAAHLTDKAGRPVLVAAKEAPAQIAALGRALDHVRAATARAEAEDAAHTQAVAVQQDAITKEHQDDLEDELAAARARAAAHAHELRSRSADPVARRDGDGGASPLPAAANPAGAADGAGPAAVMAADDRACAEAVTKAQGWQDWWRDQATAPR
jgi:hypothetical protein